MDFWTAQKELETGKLYRSQIGPLVIWFKRNLDEIKIAIERLPNEPSDNILPGFERINTSDYLNNLEWKRWVVGESTTHIKMIPVMPDRPVVVRPDIAVKIPKFQQALFFVSIPVWIRIAVNNYEQVTLCEEPSLIRSNIWFGDLMSGELCYSLRSRAHRNIAESETKPYRVTCPVLIKNTTSEQFDFERLCVHVQYLNIFKGSTRLWTNEVLINFQGEETNNKIDYACDAPKYETIHGLIGYARTQFKQTLLKKSLGTFKQLTGF